MTPFAQHVAAGLAAPQAFLSSRFIYDERGSRLFQEIMALEEYYLTRCETEVFERYAAAIASAFVEGGRPLEIVELGAGDGSKTRLLIAALRSVGADFVYRPVDISGDILRELSTSMRAAFPGLIVEPLQGSYDEVLASLRPIGDVRRVVLFLGSNVGNFPLSDAEVFLARVTVGFSESDQLLLGVDLRKDPRVILRAYDDAAGVTARFNLNLLHRLRNELDAEVEVGAWDFYPTYNPETGEVRSYLYPTSAQRVRIPRLGIDRLFGTHETIHTEISRKYSREELAALAEACGCRVRETWTDSGGRFADVLWERG